MQLHEYSALELAELINKRELSPVELTRHCLERIDRYNDELNAFITIDHEGALQAAKEAENSSDGLLRGLPIAIKDLSLTKGLRSTSGSLTLKDSVPQEDSVAVERVRRQGAVIVGKSNTPEFGYKGVTDNRLLPPCANPWNLERTSGGSSGGSAAAMAAGLCPLAEGTDGAGSIRIPAGFCGVVGVKPSFARVPRYPIPDIYYNLSHTGPITTTVADAIMLLYVQSGPDRRDPCSITSSLCDDVPGCEAIASASTPEQFYTAVREYTELKASDARYRVAWSADLGYAPVDPEILQICQTAVQKLTAIGHTVTPNSPGFSDPEPIELNIWNVVYAERYAPLSPETRALFTPELAGLIDEGMKVSAYQMGRDAMARTKLYYQSEQFFQNYDVMITPTLPVEAFPLTQQRPQTIAGRSINTLFGWTPFTYPFNLTGQPAVTVPAGYTKNGLPVGIQLVGPRGSEMRLLKLAAQFEKIAPWQRLAPDFR